MTFEPSKAVELVDELAKFVKEKGYGAFSKNDMYDYILYLLDKYGVEKFLTGTSNAENAVLFKATPAKIKTAKLNIFLKFADTDKQAGAMKSFLRQIAEGAIRVDEAKGKEENDSVKLTIEDPVIQFCLDAEMKESVKTGPDTRFNREIVVIAKKDFYELIRAILNQRLKISPETREALLSEYGKANENLRGLINYITRGIEETVKNMGWPIPVETIIAFMKTVSQKIGKKKQ